MIIRMDVSSDKYRDFWNYLSQPQKDLILQGQYLQDNVLRNNDYRFKDYSFLVFPFAKAYEGFLKQLFKDIKFISHLDYISDHLRLGKLMSPNLEYKLGDRSLYKKMRENVDQDFADRVWNGWKLGRNQVFHYFPHNTKAISFQEAEKIVGQMVEIMQEAFVKLKVQNALPVGRQEKFKDK